MADKKPVYWPHNTMLYMTLKQIKASMPKPGTGRIYIPKPTKPNRQHPEKKVR